MKGFVNHIQLANRRTDKLVLALGCSCCGPTPVLDLPYDGLRITGETGLNGTVSQRLEQNGVAFVTFHDCLTHISTWRCDQDCVQKKICLRQLWKVTEFSDYGGMQAPVVPYARRPLSLTGMHGTYAPTPWKRQFFHYIVLARSSSLGLARHQILLEPIRS